MNIWQIGRAALKSLHSLNGGERKSFPTKSRRLLLEPLEHRALLTVSVASITGPQTGGGFAVPSGKDLYVPVTGSDTTTQGINYTASVDATAAAAGVTATVVTGDELILNVSGTTAGGVAFSGALTFELFANIAPQTVAAIETDVANGLYNGAEFYRSETSPTFALIQGGIQPPSGVISGKTVPAKLTDEFNSAATFNSSGLLAMANGGPGTATSEFFVTAPNTPLADEPQSLNGGYTIFGQFLSGQAIYNDILNVPTTADNGIDYDNAPVTITSASIVKTGQDDAVIQISEPSTYTGTATVTVVGTGSTDNTTATQTFTVAAAAPAVSNETAPPVFLSPISNPATTEGTPVSFTVTANAQDASEATYTEPTFTVTGTGPYSTLSSATLPSNVTVSYGTPANGMEKITLTPAAGFTGTLNLVVNTVEPAFTSASTGQVERSAEYDSLPVTLTVNAGLTITTTSVPNWTIGQAYTPGGATETLAASGGTGTDSFAVTSGTIPPGLTLAANGQVTGTPTSAGTYTFTVTATDQASATATQNYSVTINNLPSITTTALPSITVGSAYNATLQTSGGTSPFKSFVLASGTLPAGLVLSNTGVISGTPTATSTGSITVTATDAAGASVTSQAITFAINITLTPTTLPSSTQGQNYNQTLTASGGTGSYTYSVISGSLPATSTGTLALSNTGVISGVPSAAGTYTFTVQAKDGSGDTGTQQYTIVINPPLTITTSTLPAAVAGAAYSATIQTSGGTAPLAAFSQITNLPAGLSFNQTTGVISGTPTTAGAGTSFTVTATDSSGATAKATYTLPVSLGITPTTLSQPQWTLGTAGYSSSALTVAGGSGNYTFSIGSGQLPTGLTLNTSTGAITGTPTPAASGVFTFTVAVKDNTTSNTGSQQYTLTINPKFSIPVTALPAVTVGTAYNYMVPTSGGTGGATNFSITAGTLPTGLQLNGTTGVISGSVSSATAGTTSITIAAKDSIGDTTTQVVSLAANLGITPTTLPNWTSGLTGYSQQLSGSGGNGTYTFSALASSLPPGLTLSSSGKLSGTPTAPGTYAFTVTAADTAGDAGSQTYNVTINPAITIGTTSLANWTLNQTGYSQAILANGGTGTDTFSVTAGSLPAGLNLGSTTGVISGTPTTAGTSTFTVTVTDQAGATALQAYSVTINPALTITTTTLPSGTQNKAYSQTIAISGGTGADTFAVTSGTLPTGLALNASTGVISGTPTTVSNGAGSITVTATDSTGNKATQSYSFSINKPITFTTTTLPSSYINEAYNQTIPVSGGTGAITYTITSGALPAGLTLSTSTGSTAGVVISGTPTASSTTPYSFTITATDAAGATATQSDTLTISPFALTVAGATNPTESTLPSWTANLAGYSQTITANGAKGTVTFSVSSGTLPAGLSIAPSTGVLSGTPTTAGSYSFTIAAADSSSPVQTASQPYTLTINPALTVTPTTFPGLSLATPVSTTIGVGTGTGTGADTFSVRTGSLPAGLSLNSATGVITGTPTTAGAYSFAVTATDSVGATATQTYSGSVTSLGLSGTVYDDVNKNGVLDSGEPGIAGVIVSMNGTDSSGNPLPSQTTTTASNGTYSFTGIPAGTYSLSIDEPSKLSGGSATVISNLAVTAGGSSTSGANNNFNAGSAAAATGPITINSFLASTLTETQAIAKAVTASTTAPVVTSITLANANPTSAATVSYNVNFNQNVAGVTQSDFGLTASSGITGESITSVTGSGSSYNVVVNTGSGAGTLTLSVLKTATITNAAGTALGGTGSGVNNFTGPSYNVEKIAVAITTVPTAINTNNENSTTVSGTGEAGATISVIASDSAGDKTAAATGTVTSAGTWSITGINVSTLKDGTITYTATATDSQNGSLSTTMTTTKDTVVPTVAITTATGPINLNNQTAASLSGTVTAGDTVSVTATDTASTPNKVTAAATVTGGTWSVSGLNLTSLVDGTITYTVTATDPSGNTATATQTATKNTTTPAVALTTVTTPITFSNEKATVASGTAANGTTISVVATDGTTTVNAPQTVTVGSSGTWSISGIDVSGLKDGTITYTATATNPTTGNTTTVSDTTTKDTVVPTVTITSATSPISAANAGSVSLSGTVTAGDTVSVTASDSAATPNTQTMAATVSGTSWTLTGLNLSTLVDGKITYTVTATDPSKNTATATQTVTKDTVVPTLTVGTVGALNATNDGSVSVSGTVSTGATVTVVATDGTNSTSQTATVTGGTWTLAQPLNLSTFNDGAITFTATATDSAGINTTQVSTTTVKNTLALTTASPLPPGANDVAYSTTLATSGGSGGNTFSLMSGTLPAGLNLTATGTNAGQITGTPTGATNTTSTFTIQVKDSVGGTASQTYTITINSFAITPTTLPNWTINQSGYSQTLTASSGTAAFSVSQGNLPTGLGLSNGTISGTPTVAGSYSFTIMGTENGVNPATQNYTIVINPAVSVSPTTLPAWTTGQSGYSQTITAAGGTGNITFALAQGSTLPTGLTLGTSANDTVAITGTPTASGSFTLVATDSTGATESQVYTFTANPALTLGTSTLAPTTAGIAYTASLPASGGTAPYSFKVTSGTLPTTATGTLTLNPTTGALSGTPSVAGAYTFTVQVTDSSGAEASQSYSITVNAAIAVTQTTLPNPIVNASYSQTITTTGGTGNITLSIPAANLPPGLTFTSTPANPGSGTLSGTPTTNGTYTFILTATDTAGATTTQSYTVTVAAFSLSPTSPTLAAGTVGETTYSQTITASGGTPTFTSTGTLPPGLLLSTGGVISGTPTTAGTYSFTVIAAENGVPSVQQSYSITINAALAITTTALPTPVLGTAYTTTTVATSGGTGADTFAVTTGSLPTGLNLTQSGTNAGQISGTPTASGAFTFTVTATDTSGVTAKQTYTLTVSPPVTITVGSPTVNLENETTTSASGMGETGDAISVTVTDGAGTPAGPYTATVAAGGTWSISGIDVSGLQDGPLTYTVTITGGVGTGSTGITNTATATATKSTVAITSVTPTSITAANDTSVTVSGTGEPGASLTVVGTFGTGADAPSTATYPTAGALTIGTNGQWTISGIDVSGLSDGTLTFTATATSATVSTDIATATATANKSTVAISNVNSNNIINANNDTATTVTGTGVTGATVKVTASDGTTKLTAPTVTVSNGSWTVSGFDVHTLLDSSANVTITFTAMVTNPNGTIGTAMLTATKDTVAPTVSSITLVAGDNPASTGSQVAFTVTFSEAVELGDDNLFSLAQSGGVTGATIASVTPTTGSNTTYTVTVNTGSGGGTLGLNVVPDATTVDASGNSLTVGSTGPAYTINAPAVTPAVTGSDLTDAALASESYWT